jgi:CheY-like chemotaxis protein
MNCPECGQENSATARFCVHCGFQFRTASAAATSPLGPAPALPDDARAGDRAAAIAPPSGAPPPPPPDFGRISTSATGPLTNSFKEQAGTQEFKPRDFLLMVVDDTPDSLVVISLQLQQEGFRVITASNGEEALKIAEVSAPDLILMDISMPELDGLGATRRLRAHPTLKNVPVVATTAFSTDGFRRAAYDAGMDGYLLKPLDFDRLGELVRKLLPVRTPPRAEDTDEDGE